MHFIEYRPQWRKPWNEGKLIGQKLPLKLKEIWAVQIRLQLGGTGRDLALFNLAINSKLRGCDLECLRVRDVAQGVRIAERTMIMQRKTWRPVRFEITGQIRESVAAWIAEPQLKSHDYLFPGLVRVDSRPTTRPLDQRHRTQSCRPRDALPPPYQGSSDLPQKQRPDGLSTPLEVFQAGKHGQALGN